MEWADLFRKTLDDPIYLQMNKDSFRQRIPAGAVLLGVSCLVVLTACVKISQQRLLYDASGIQIGLVTDLSVEMDAYPPVINSHPAEYSPQEIRALMGSLQVSGWSGALLGFFATPQPQPVFTEAELNALAEPLAAAFHEATVRDRVFFILRNPGARYETDRTSGCLFFRDDYLYVVLTDHYAFLHADPGGGEKRDPRDTKGMKLWVTPPALAAAVPDAKEPRWNQFETVHISLKPAEVLAALATPPAVAESSRQKAALPAAGQPASKAVPSMPHAPDSENDLRLQLRELTNANLDLRSQMKEQAATIEKLKAELEQLRIETKSGNSKPSSGRQAPRKQPVQ